MRYIEKRTPNSKWEKADTSHETPKTSIKWKEGIDLKNNKIQVALTLSAFVGVNIISVHEVAKALDTTKCRITEFETTLETIKDAMEINIRKYILGIKYIHRDEIEKNP